MKLSTYAFTSAALLLAACAGSTGTSVSENRIQESQPDRWVSTTWITKYRREVVAQIVSYVRGQESEIRSGLPRVQIRSVRVKNEVHQRNVQMVREVEPVLRDLFQEVSDQLIRSPGPRALVVDVEVAFLSPGSTEAEAAAAGLALMPVCFGTLFLACPAKSTNYVTLDLDVWNEGHLLGKARGTGAATRIVTSVLVDDSADPKTNGTLEANAKALSAAVADVGAKLYPYLSQNRAP